MLQYLIVNSEDGTHFFISNDVWGLIHRYKQDSFYKAEQGGIFLGKERENSIEIVEATIPQREDKFSRFNFFRKSQNHQEIATDRWLNSDSTITYCGEWHTHPEKIAKPSNADIREWKMKLRGYSIPLLLVVIGLDSDWLGVMSTKGVLREIRIK